MISYSDAALTDLERLYRWLLERNSNTARRFLDDLKRAEAFIAANPSACAAAAGGAARRHIMRFGASAYVIYFVEDGADQVIVRLWHGRKARA